MAAISPSPGTAPQIPGAPAVVQTQPSTATFAQDSPLALQLPNAGLDLFDFSGLNFGPMPGLNDDFGNGADGWQVNTSNDSWNFTADDLASGFGLDDFGASPLHDETGVNNMLNNADPSSFNPALNSSAWLAHLNGNVGPTDNEFPAVLGTTVFQGAASTPGPSMSVFSVSTNIVDSRKRKRVEEGGKRPAEKPARKKRSDQGKPRGPRVEKGPGSTPAHPDARPKPRKRNKSAVDTAPQV